MVDDVAVGVIKRYLSQLQQSGMDVRCAVLFGSRASGSHGHESDIDVLVVSPRFDNPTGRSDADLLWRVAAQTDSRLEPIPCGERQWAEDQGSPLLEVVRRQGFLIAA